MSSHLEGTAWTWMNRPCVITTHTTTAVWVQFLDGQEPALGKTTPQRFGREGHPIRGPQGRIWERVGKLVVTDREDPKVALRMAMAEAEA